MTEKPNILIVGASSGLGRDLAIKLSSENNVIAMARREEKLKELSEYGIHSLQFDVCSFDEIPNLFKNIASNFGKLDALIYCAGVQSIMPLKFSKLETVRNIMDINYFGAMFFAKSFISNKFSHKNSKFVAISSIAADLVEPGIINYGASKAALNSLIKGYAKEAAPRRFNAISPGFLKTEMTETLNKIYNDEFIENCEKNYPLGLGNTDNICDAVEFLISDRSSYITGQIMTVDGGGSL